MPFCKLTQTSTEKSLDVKKYRQKQPPRGVPRKSCSKNM